jgi:endonuclease/exonuclease/phosphatase family metal-dependent hydrolase
LILRVASWNVRECVAYATGQPSFDPVELISRIAPDILALQEVPFITDGSSVLLSDLRDRTELTNLSAFPLGPSSFHSDRHSGVATVSKYPFVSENRVWIKNPGLSIHEGVTSQPAHDKGILASKLSHESMEINVCNFHMFPFNRIGRPASDQIFASMWNSVQQLSEAFADSPSILLGDFNTPDRMLTERYFPSVSRAIGDVPTHEGFAADDILFSPHFKFVRRLLLENDSDHLLCVGEFQI